MRLRTLLLLLLAHLVGSYFGAGLLVVLARAIDHWAPPSFWHLLKAAPVAVPRFVFDYVFRLDPPKLLAMVIVVAGYAAGFYVVWKLSYSFRIPRSRLERGRGFEVALTQSRVPDNVVESERGER